MGLTTEKTCIQLLYACTYMKTCTIFPEAASTPHSQSGWDLFIWRGVTSHKFQTDNPYVLVFIKSLKTACNYQFCFGTHFSLLNFPDSSWQLEQSTGCSCPWLEQSKMVAISLKIQFHLYIQKQLQFYCPTTCSSRCLISYVTLGDLVVAKHIT